MDSPSRVACDVCGKYFYTDVSLKMHVVRSHGQRTMTTLDSQPVAGIGGCSTATEENAGRPVSDLSRDNKPVGKKGSRCATCKRCFPNDRRLASHVHAAHPTHVGGFSTGITNTSQPVSQLSIKEQCDNCGQFFVKLSNHRKCSGKSVQFSPVK